MPNQERTGQIMKEKIPCENCICLPMCLVKARVVVSKGLNACGLSITSYDKLTDCPLLLKYITKGKDLIGDKKYAEFYWKFYFDLQDFILEKKGFKGMYNGEETPM